MTTTAQNENAKDRLIVALDTPDAKGALDMVSQLEGTVGWFKIGLELYVAEGPSIIEKVKRSGARIFLDLKLHDIPNTVAGAVRSAAAQGVDLLTLHALGGPAMLAAAKSAAESAAKPPQLLAVTVLTSMDQQQLAAIGLTHAPAAEVELLARMGLAAGINGFVCSPEEVENLRAITGPDGVLVTPGVRPAGAEVGDQKRIATPAAAIARGASHLVVGRPITQAADPRAAAAAILQEIAAAV